MMRSPFLISFVAPLFARPRRRHLPRAAERGMTLIEIMVVVVIMALVSGVVGVAVLNRLQTARQKTAFTQMKQIAEALELYKLDMHNYPSTAEGLQALVSPKGNARPYMPSMPRDPWDRDFVYMYPGSAGGGGFDLMSYGEDGIQGTEDDINNNQTAEGAGQPTN